MNPLSTKLLEDARTILEERGWTQGALAKNAEGEECASYAHDAVCFCSEGALRKAFHKRDRFEFDRDWTIAEDRAREILNIVFDGSVPRNNDKPSTTKEQVLMAFDLAILIEQET